MIRCPHCTLVGKHRVTETRNTDGVVHRRRRCTYCSKGFVSRETTDPGYTMPPEHNNSRKTTRQGPRVPKINDIFNRGGKP